MIFSSIKSGIAQMWANKRLILVYYFTNLIFALILVLPFQSVLRKFIGHSLMGAKLGGRFDMDFFFEFLKYSSAGISAIKGLFLLVPLGFWLFSLFLSGGALFLFISGEKYSPSLFWGTAANYFGRFFRLVLWSLPVIGILFCLQFIWDAVERIFFGKDPYQYITYWGFWIKIVLRYISIFLISMILDYGRIYTVITGERKMRLALLQGIKFTFNNFTKTFGLVLIFFVVAAIVLVIYNPIADMLAAPSVIIIVLLFLLQQAYMLFRTMFKLSKFSSQVQLFRKLTPQ